MFSQIDDRVAFFRNVSGGDAYLAKIADARATMVDTTPVSSITQGSQYGANDILRDMGRTVTIVNNEGLALKRYRSVNIVNKEAKEYTEYVLVWDASGGSGVNVVRQEAPPHPDLPVLPVFPVRAPSQIDSRVAFLRAVGTAPPTSTSAGGAVTITYPASIYRTSSNNVIAAAARAIAVGDLYRDMGKTVTVVNTEGLPIERYRLAQLVNNSAAEGVNDVNVYIKVWAANNAGVVVARTG